MEREGSSGLTLTKLGLGVLAFNSGLAIYNSWGDAGSVAFVLVADAALVLLFLCLREFEQQGCGRGKDAKTKTKAAVWALTTLLTAMFHRAPPTIMPLGVGALVFVCLHDVNRQVRGGGGMNMDGQYWALAKVGIAMLTCETALDGYNTRRDDAASAVLVFVSYLVLVILTGLFVRAFARAHAGEQEQH